MCNVELAHENKMVWRPGQVENFDIFSRLNTTYECDGQTDRQTDRQTEACRRLVPRLRIASRGISNKLCGRPPQYAPASCKLTFDLLTLKVVSESRVTSATSVLILVFLDLSVLDLGAMYTTDR